MKEQECEMDYKFKHKQLIRQQYNWNLQLAQLGYIIDATDRIERFVRKKKLPKALHYCARFFVGMQDKYKSWFRLTLNYWQIGAKLQVNHLINNPAKSWCTHSAIHSQTIGPIEKFISLKFLKFL